MLSFSRVIPWWYQKQGLCTSWAEVNKPGGYVMNSFGGVTVLQLIAATGGPTRMACYGWVKIIRRTPSGLHQVPAPLKPLLHAKVADLPIQHGDILCIPKSRAKSALAESSSLVNIAMH
jgi:protein involved in polysaccharide export with SLBB domain